MKTVIYLLLIVPILVTNAKKDCVRLGSQCTDYDDCCKLGDVPGRCSDFTSTCCVAHGGKCVSNNDCCNHGPIRPAGICTNYTDSIGTCHDCSALGGPCLVDYDCCSHPNGAFRTCHGHKDRPVGHCCAIHGPCTSNNDCCDFGGDNTFLCIDYVDGVGHCHNDNPEL